MQTSFADNSLELGLFSDLEHEEYTNNNKEN